MSAIDRRLFAESLPARRQLVGTVLFGLLAAALIVAQATLLTDVILTVTAPLIPVFMALIGRYTRSRTARQWSLLAGLGGHFLDVVEGLPTLKMYGRAQPQVGVIRRVTERYRQATMATLRIAFI